MAVPLHSFGDDALGDLDAVGVAERIATREISCEEAVEAGIARVRAVDAELHAVAFEAFETARAQARGTMPSTARPFAGVPSFVKDNTDVAGMPSAHGSVAFRPLPAKRATRPAQQFLAQGYIVLGKTTLPEFGLTASTEFVDRPATRNPWDRARSAGASSGGSAALVAAGAVPIAHANDGGGSIRIPAAANGLVGLKATRGRLLDGPAVRQLPLNLVCEGVVSRTVRDTAHHLAAMERTAHHPRLPVVGLVEGPGRRRLRIGVARVSPSGIAVHAETASQTQATADLLAELGHHLSDVQLPSGAQFVDDFTLYWGFGAALLAKAAGALNRGRFDSAKLDPITQGLAENWRRNKARTPAAIRRLRAARAAYDAMFEHCDVVLSPTLNHPTPEIGYLDPSLGFDEVFNRMTSYVGFTPVNNVCGGPGISLPTPLGTQGTPGAIHLSAAWGDEATLLRLAYELEAARPFPDITAVTAIA